MTRSIFLLLVLFGFQSFAAETALPRSAEKGLANDRSVLVYSVRLRMPYGASVWEDSFPATGSSPLHILFTKDSACPRSPHMNVYVRAAGTTHWQPTRFQNGYDYYEGGGSIDGLRFEISQPYYTSMTCSWKVYAEAGGTDPVLTNEELIGALNYGGGFANDMEFLVNPARVVTQFRLAVPEFCQGMEILAASTVTEGVKDKATLVSKSQNLFSVNQGNGSRISKILVSANGPINKACQVPVYVKTK